MKFGYEKTVNNRKTQKGSNRRLFDFVDSVRLRFRKIGLRKHCVHCQTQFE